MNNDKTGHSASNVGRQVEIGGDPKPWACLVSEILSTVVIPSEFFAYFDLKGCARRKFTKRHCQCFESWVSASLNASRISPEV